MTGILEMMMALYFSVATESFMGEKDARSQESDDQ